MSVRDILAVCQELVDLGDGDEPVRVLMQRGNWLVSPVMGLDWNGACNSILIVPQHIPDVPHNS